VGCAELVQRSTSARRRAAALTEQSQALTEAARHAFEAAMRLRGEMARGVRCRPQTWAGARLGAGPHFRSFEVEGLIGDVPVKAVALDGTLVCDPLLKSHAEVVVALGERLIVPGDGPPSSRFARRERARLDGPPEVVLATLVRAMRVTKLRVRFGPGGVIDV
jgi:hypothetical protein